MNLKNKKILVTGADGFIGSQLVEKLVQYGCDVRAFVYYNSFSSWGWLDTSSKAVTSKIEVVSGDVRDYSSVNKAVEGCDVVFHLAALIAIPYSYESPESYVQTNIIGTLNVLQAVRNNNVERLLVTSTSEVYGTAQYAPIDESHPFQGQSPYSATKIGADRLAESFFKSFDTPVVIVRPFNTYGPRQSARAIIPTVITQLMAGVEELKLGNLKPTRDFNFIDDTVNGFIALSESDLAIGREVNIATCKEYSIETVVETLVSEINPNAKVVTDAQRLRPDASEVFQLIGDNKLIKELTKWEPQYDLELGLKMTVEWFKSPENLKCYKALNYNL
jgi:NAD dependent epimerase/dehydratase